MSIIDGVSFEKRKIVLPGVSSTQHALQRWGLLKRVSPQREAISPVFAVCFSSYTSRYFANCQSFAA